MTARAHSVDYAGRVVAGRYLLESKLGEGGMGSVWAARHLTLDSKVAIKLLDPAIAADAQAAARFVREAQAAASLRSPHVVQVLDHGIDETTPFIAMELLEGESLAERLARIGRLSPEDTARILSDVARALGKAHESGIVHRDLKPANVFLSPNDDLEIAKVLDFGIAKRSGYDASAAQITQSGAVFGSPYYMSPEQAEDSKDLDHRTDVWSLAVVAYECLLGARPFEGKTLASVFLAICSKPIPVPSQRGPVPPGFDAWFARATQRDPQQRFDSVKQAATALREICHASFTPVTQVTPPPVADDELVRSFKHSGPKNRARVLAVGVLIALGTAAYAWSRSSIVAKPAIAHEAAGAKKPQPAAQPAEQSTSLPHSKPVSELAPLQPNDTGAKPSTTPAIATDAPAHKPARAHAPAEQPPAIKTATKVDLGL